jgi:hypothetical protein
LVAGTAIAAIAAKHGLSQDSVARHRANHLVGVIAKASEAEEVARGDGLLAQVREQQVRAEGLYLEAEKILRRAQRRRDPDIALEAIRTAATTLKEARGSMELLARLAGELQETTVNIVVAPQWLALRGRILVALAPFPEARVAVSQALLEAGDAGP